MYLCAVTPSAILCRRPRNATQARLQDTLPAAGVLFLNSPETTENSDASIAFWRADRAWKYWTQGQVISPAFIASSLA